jgi:hypothetical protein
MMMKSSVLSSLTMTIIFGAFVLYAVSSLGAQARLMPLLVAIPGFGFSGFQLILDFRKELRGSLEQPLLEVQQWRILFWITASIPVIVLLGFDIGTPIMVAAYHRFVQRERFTIALLSIAIAWFFIAIVLDRFFGAQLFPGLLLPVIAAWFK